MKKVKQGVKKIAASVVERPDFLTIKIENPSFWDRILIWLKIKKDRVTFTIKRPSIGLTHRLTELFQDLKDIDHPEEREKDWANEFRAKNTFVMAEIVATYIHGKWREETPKWLIEFVLDNVDDHDLLSISKIIDSQTNILPFISSIASMISLDIVSKSLEASPQDTEEIIAPGES